MIELFSELGLRLGVLAWGERADYQAVVAAAVEANPWFSAREIRLAAENLATDMLSPERLREWMAACPRLSEVGSVTSHRAAQQADVLIVMAGNVPFVGLQDLVCVLASGHRAIVKPSSKDEILMRWTVAQLIDIQPFTQVSFEGDPNAVIAMGGDDAVEALRAKYAGLPMLLRGHRSSLAVLDGTENGKQLNDLANDILTFSGLGCRNVSLVFVPRGYDFSELQNIAGQRVDYMNIKYRNNLRQARAKLRMAGAPHIDCGACLLVDKSEFSSNVSICNYAFYDHKDEVAVWILQHADEIQCAVAETSGIAARTVDFGRAQRPGLTDYPDGVDTVKFLQSIR